MAIVAVFGGSAPKPGSAAYNESVEMGRLLAVAGHAVATGGYTGVMEGASRGAADAGGHVIGVTCGLIESWREGFAPNAWVKEVIKYDSLRERLYHLISFCDAAVALSGGIGTLSEISLLWSLMQTSELPGKPLVLVGPVWRTTFEAFLAHADGYIAEPDRSLITIVDNVESVLDVLAIKTTS
jgi:uncharacterized protein (TIGR00730 family)